ncbi:MAG: tetratricopeptide repeat protein, partial [Bacteroidota bacterium]|nr:tetratricopeptide repeat protein [Bacteroidota bacterium]
MILKYLLRKAQDDFNAKRYNAEIKKLNWILLLNPIAFNYGLRGGIHRLIGNLDKAIKDYSKAIELDSENCEYYNGRAG